MRCDTRVVAGQEVRVFPPDRADAGRRLVRMLSLAAHPGVTELSSWDESDDHTVTVRTRALDGGRLSAAGRLPVEEACGTAVALATTLSDLHHISVVHGGLRPEIVSLDGDGRPVLGGFDDAATESELGPRWKRARAEDVVALRAMVLWLVNGSVPQRRERQLARRLHRCRSASEVAERVLAWCPEARLGPPPERSSADEPERASEESPGEESAGAEAPGAEAAGEAAAGEEAAGEEAVAGDTTPPDRQDRHPRPTRRFLRPVVTAAAGTAVLVAVYLLAGRGTGAARRPAAAALRPAGAPITTSSASTLPCPPVDRGCAPLPLADGVISDGGRRYRIGAGGDVVVVGRWTCAGIGLPAVLRPSSGDVWIFDRWPTTATIMQGTLVANVAGARSLRVVVGAHGCDLLQVVRGPGQGPVSVTPR